MNIFWMVLSLWELGDRLWAWVFVCMKRKELSKNSFNKKSEYYSTLEFLNIELTSIEMHQCKKARSGSSIGVGYSYSIFVVMLKYTNHSQIRNLSLTTVFIIYIFIHTYYIDICIQVYIWHSNLNIYVFKVKSSVNRFVQIRAGIMIWIIPKSIKYRFRFHLFRLWV